MRLGIDVGTTRTVVAAVDRGNYPIVTFENAEGDFQEWYPSLVAVRGDERCYGFAALERMQDRDWQIYRSFKRLLGSVAPNGDIFGVHASTLIGEFLASLNVALKTRSNIDADDPLEVIIGVPANSNSNQRFLTIEGFHLAGFRVAGVYEEPVAAGIEYAHRYRQADITRKREHLLVYDLGGGTFDCSVIRITGHDHSVLASSGIGQLGGDDFDQILLDLAQEEMPGFSHRLLEICRLAKERLNPNTRRILLNSDDREIAVPVDEFYKRCAGLIERTIPVVESVIARIGGEETLSCVYLVGGGSEFPPVARTLRTRFGRRVRKSAYSHAATAVGLAILADTQSEVRVERTFSRNFGVWREMAAGSAAAFDTIFPKGALIPSRAERRYRPVHNIGHFRYLECAEIDDSQRPVGDMAPWDAILFPFESLPDESLSTTLVQESHGGSSAYVEEIYTCDETGIIQATIRNLDTGYHRVYTLHHR